MGSFSIWHWLVVMVVVYLIFGDWRRTYDWYLIRRFIRRTKFQRWRVTMFASWFADVESIKVRAKQVNDEGLLWALKLSDHGDKARKVIRSVLAERSFGKGDIEAWLPDPAAITVPLSSVRSDPGSYYRSIRRRQIWKVTLRVWAIVAGAIFLLSLLDTTGIIGATFTLLLYCLAVLAAIAMWHTRRRTLRVLLLRPFGKRRLSKPLQALTLSSLGRIGSVYTLSDRNYRPNFLLLGLDRIIGLGNLVTGPIFRRSYRVASIRNERTFLNFARKLSKWRMRNFMGLLTGDQAFNIKSSDDWWQMSIDMLLHSTELVVMDVSRIGPGSAWEIGHMARRGLVENCLFIVQEGFADEGIATVAKMVPHVSVKIWRYRSTGRFVEAEGFQKTVDERINAAFLVQAARANRGSTA
jgi:hypothetical protein